MSKPAVEIQHYMTSVLHLIAAQQSVREASRVMREHGIRHLPVVRGGRTEGILSERDIYLVETLAGVDPAAVKVEEVMRRDLYVVEPDEPLQRVVTTMAERKLGSAIVAHGGKTVGLFTTTDALQALAALIEDAWADDAA